MNRRNRADRKKRKGKRKRKWDWEEKGCGRKIRREEEKGGLEREDA